MSLRLRPPLLRARRGTHPVYLWNSRRPGPALPTYLPRLWCGHRSARSLTLQVGRKSSIERHLMTTLSHGPETWVGNTSLFQRRKACNLPMFLRRPAHPSPLLQRHRPVSDHFKPLDGAQRRRGEGVNQKRLARRCDDKLRLTELCIFLI